MDKDKFEKSKKDFQSFLDNIKEYYKVELTKNQRIIAEKVFNGERVMIINPIRYSKFSFNIAIDRAIKIKNKDEKKNI